MLLVASLSLWLGCPLGMSSLISPSLCSMEYLTSIVMRQLQVLIWLHCTGSHVSSQALPAHSTRIVYNMDETVSFYRQVPRRTLSGQNASGCKTCRYSAFPTWCCNAEWFTQDVVVCHRNVERWQEFQALSASLRVVQYLKKKSVWHTSETFEEWLQCLSLFIAQRHGSEKVWSVI